jgi:hypothetical protein
MTYPEDPANRARREALGLPWLEYIASQRDPMHDFLERATKAAKYPVLLGWPEASAPEGAVVVGWYMAHRTGPRMLFYVIPREDWIASAHVAATLDVSLRRAQQLVREHPEARQEGAYLRLPARCLDDLRDRPAPGYPKGRPRK